MLGPADSHDDGGAAERKSSAQEEETTAAVEESTPPIPLLLPSISIFVIDGRHSIGAETTEGRSACRETNQLSWHWWEAAKFLEALTPAGGPACRVVVFADAPTMVPCCKGLQLLLRAASGTKRPTAGAAAGAGAGAGAAQGTSVVSTFIAFHGVSAATYVVVKSVHPQAPALAPPLWTLGLCLNLTPSMISLQLQLQQQRPVSRILQSLSVLVASPSLPGIVIGSREHKHLTTFFGVAADAASSGLLIGNAAAASSVHHLRVSQAARDRARVYWLRDARASPSVCSVPLATTLTAQSWQHVRVHVLPPTCGPCATAPRPAGTCPRCSFPIGVVTLEPQSPPPPPPAAEAVEEAGGAEGTTSGWGWGQARPVWEGDA